jgi:hypothetical protein
MSQFAHFDKGLIALHQLNLLPIIFPQLKTVSTEEIHKLLAPLASYPKEAPAIAEILELFPDYCLEELFTLCDYLKLSRSERDIARFVHHSKQLLLMPDDWQSKLENIEWAQFYANTHSKITIEMIAAHLSPSQRDLFLQKHHLRRELLKGAIFRIQSHSPIVRADHLIKEGLVPGKKMGLALKEAERISVNEGIEDRDTIIRLLKNSPVWNT